MKATSVTVGFFVWIWGFFGKGTLGWYLQHFTFEGSITAKAVKIFDLCISSKKKVSNLLERLFHSSPLKDVFGNRLRVGMTNACLYLVPGTHNEPEGIIMLKN